jgi:two-component system CheB/CheR fusion protein
VRSTELNEINFFFESVLRSLQVGVAVTDRELRVQVWNSEAENLWGLRGGEARGEHLLNLDIGLPVDRLRAPVRAILAGTSEREALTLDATNRRGRAVQLHVSLVPLADASQIRGVVILMDVSEPGGVGRPAG